MKFTPRLRTILLFLNMVTLILPLIGILVFRFYENELIRQTESNLILQGAVIRETYKSELLSQMRSKEIRKYGLEYSPHSVDQEYGPFDPIFPSLDLSKDPVNLPGPDAEPAKIKPNSKAMEVGRKISNILNESQRVTFAGVRVLDYNGNIVASSRGEVGLSMINWPEVQMALRGSVAKSFRRRVSDKPPPALDAISRASRIRIFVALPVVYGKRILGVVILSRSPSNILKGLYDNRTKLFTALFIVFGVMLFVVVLTSFFLSRPITELKRKAKQVAEGKFKGSLIIKNPGSLEVRELAESLKKMTESLQQRGAYIETFSRNVSHEFKTPLTSMRGTIELLKEHYEEMSSEEREQFINNLDSEVDRLNRLVQKLMELAKADVIEPDQETTDVESALKEVVGRYNQKNLTLNTEKNLGTISMGPLVFDSIITNLIENAFQHGGGGVAVQIRAQKKSNNIVDIQVEDSGKGISEANQKRIFDAFFTTSRDSGGTGLGLSITKSLIEAHNGRIDLSSSPKGVIFSLKLVSL